jgi:hypothetical protein
LGGGAEEDGLEEAVFHVGHLSALEVVALLALDKGVEGSCVDRGGEREREREDYMERD